MNIRRHYLRICRQALAILLAATMAFVPSASVLAQTNAAAQAVRGRVQGLGQAEDPAEAPTSAIVDPSQPPTSPTQGAVDTTFVVIGYSLRSEIGLPCHVVHVRDERDDREYVVDTALCGPGLPEDAFVAIRSSSA